jgi:hypothetical protein
LAAGDEPGISGIVGDAVDDWTGLAGVRVGPAQPRVEDLHRQDEKIRRVQHIEDRAAGPTQAQDERQLDLDTRRGRGALLV